jgi:predicted phosphodiesterase
VTLKFSLVSDLHVNHPQPKIPYDQLEDLVIIAGDTSNGLDGLKFINKLKNEGHSVFAIDGNHKHYSNDSRGRTIDETEIQFYDLLNQPRIIRVAPDLWVIGCNAWYLAESPDIWLSYLNDGRYCGSYKDVNTKACEQASWLKYSLERLEGRVIVVTHTAPCLDTLNPQYDGHFSNEWYWNPLTNEILKQYADKIAVWCHGHTHAPTDKIVSGVRVICQPRGYPGENPDWKPLTIEVELP